MSDTLILIVDDNDDVRLTLSSLIELHGYRVKALKDGSEVLEYLHQNPGIRPDLLISDLMMNKVDGIDLLANIRKDSRYDKMIFALHTGADLSVFSSLLKPYKIDSIIPKPCSPEKLEAELLRLLKKHAAIAA